jgi:hypothetical protein
VEIYTVQAFCHKTISAVLAWRAVGFRRKVKGKQAARPLIISAVRTGGELPGESNRVVSMSQVDFWYVRFPDGRVLRAASTAVLRQELSARHIPLGSTVRRSPSDEWVSLAWTQEFADVVEELTAYSPSKAGKSAGSTRTHQAASLHSGNTATNHAATVGSRLDPAQLHLVGVRSYLEELLAALDSALVPKKLLLGLIAGILLGTLFLLERAPSFEGETSWLTAAWILLAVCSAIFDGLTSLLTRLTYVELARMRPARWRHGFDGLGQLTVWVVVSKLIVWGCVGGLIVLLRWLPVWLSTGTEEIPNQGHRILGGAVLVVCILGEVLLYPVFFLWSLLPPLLVVEGGTVWSGLRQWLDLLRRHLGRVFLYQTMATGLGVLVTAPLLLLIVPLFLPAFHPPEGLQEIFRDTRLFLLGLACAPLLTYWITANVFIYLNLRYGTISQR